MSARAVAGVGLVVLLGLVPAAGAARQAPAAPPATAVPPAAAVPSATAVPPAAAAHPDAGSAAAAAGEGVYAGGLAAGWRDLGWCRRELRPGGPARLDLSGGGGWLLAREAPLAQAQGLVLRVRAAQPPETFLELRADLPGREALPRVAVEARHVRALQDGWVQVAVPAAELSPAGAPFDRVLLRATREVGADWVQVDGVALLPPAPAPVAVAAPLEVTGPARDVAMRVDCRASGHDVSPYIYGIAFDPMKLHETHWQQLRATARRWGGNPASRYNWKLGNAWNTANDWYYENTNYSGRPDYSWTHFLDENRQHGLETALTLPLIGWVAKDTSSVGFPVSEFSPQQAVDPERPHAGNGLLPSGKPWPSGSPTLTSVEAPPDFVAEWVRAIRARDAAQGGGRAVRWYLLDNEPMIWSTTHRDVRPTPLGYDELLARTVAYAGAVRRADPEGLIAGPAEWGWSNFQFSDVDLRAGVDAKPDRRAHGDVPLLRWYLRKLREHEKRTGERLLDVLDVHFYPQGADVGSGPMGGTTTETAALRLRQTRGLWDPSYVDESWIREPVMLLPRLKGWIAADYPGLKLSLGEYNFGAEGHMSGGLAQAEALGRFAEHGLDSAFLWTYPADRTPGYWGFRAFRNYDGQGGRFLDRYVPSRTGPGTSLFVSRDAEGRKLVAVVLNLEPRRAARATLQLEGCGPVRAHRALSYTGDPAGFAPLAPAAANAAKGGALTERLPAYSITVLELELEPPAPVKPPARGKGGKNAGR